MERKPTYEELEQRNKVLEEQLVKSKQAEAALRGIEIRYRLLFEYSPDGILIIDRATARPLEFNDTAHRQLGYSREEFSNLSIFNLEAAETPEETQSHIAHVIHEGRSDFEIRQRTRQGEIRNIHVTAQYTEVLGQPVYHCIWRDITEQKHIEESLRDIKDRYTMIMNNITDRIWLTDMKFNIIWASESVMRDRGYQIEEMNPFPFEKLLTPDSLETALQTIAEELTPQRLQQKDLDISKTLELEFLKKDGSTFWSEIKIKVLKDHDGVPSSILGVGRDVTERRQAEKALRENEQKIRAIFDQTFQFIGMMTPAGTLIEANRTAMQFAGICESDCIGKPFWDTPWWTHSPEMQNKLREALIEAVGGEVIRLEVTHPAADRSIHYIDFSLKPVKDELGKIIFIIAEGRDITKRKMAEEALRESEKNFRRITENTSDLVCEIDAQARYKYISPSHERILGYKPHNQIGESVFDLVHPDDKERVWAIFQEGIRTATDKTVEYRYRRSDGNYSWLRSSGHSIFGAQGEFLGAVINSSDITIRKQAEDKLCESEELFRALSENAPDIIYTMNPLGQITYVNPSWKRILGHDKEEVLGKYFIEFAKEEDRRNYRKLFKSIRDEGKTVNNYIGTMLSKDGKERVFNMNSAFNLDSQGRILGVVGSMKDVTEMREMEKKFYQTQRMESIGTLAGGIAHDFNNILGAILGYTDMALANIKTDDRQRHCLEQVYKAGERARDLVKQILTFSRPQEQERQPILIAPVIKEGIRLLRSSFPTTIKINQNIKDTSVVILADPTQLHQVLMNLCTNAAHAMRERGGTLDIQLIRERIESSGNLRPLNLTAGDYAKLTISDTGHGIDEAIMDRIFDPFFTTKGPGEGTGLGLSVVYGIVRNYGGAIDVNSEHSKGTTVSVYLPLIEAEELLQEQVSELIPRGSERILFVDDEAVLVELGNMMMVSLGYLVTSRTSSIEALEVFRANPYSFDLVITDMTMPNMRGDDLARKLLKIRPDIPIILCTGFSEMISEEKAKNLGIRQFIMKPISLKNLAGTIRKSLKVE